MSMLSSIFVLIVISFATYLAINNTDPQVAFYMPYTRAWELALGGVIAFLPEIANKRFSNFRKLLPWIGIILIGAAVFQFRSPVDFTGNKVVASVLGAFLLIYAIQPTSLLYRILASRPLVFVGKISYSIYLFHLPMIVLWKHYAGTSIIPHGYGLLFIIPRFSSRGCRGVLSSNPSGRLNGIGGQYSPRFSSANWQLLVCAGSFCSQMVPPQG